jgi:hypothetical protein
VRLQHKAFEVFADYHQFYLWDRGMNPEAPVDYTDEDCHRRIKTGPHVVVIQPERNLTVAVEVEIHDEDPGFVAAEWDHIAEASLHLPTGRLQIWQMHDYYLDDGVAEFEVEPGWYRVRSFHGGFASIDEMGLDGSDHYLAILWQAPPGKVRVVKQWVGR